MTTVLSKDSITKLDRFTELINNPKGLKSEDVVDALFQIDSFSTAELSEVYAIDLNRGEASNVENELIRGVVTSLLLANQVDLGTITKSSRPEDFTLILNDEPFPIRVVSPDKTTRAREDLIFGNTAYADAAFSPIEGYYIRKQSKVTKKPAATEDVIGTDSTKRKKKLKKTKVSSPPLVIPCQVTGLCFTDRVGVPMFLSSLLITLAEEDIDKHQLLRWKKKLPQPKAVNGDIKHYEILSIPISEKSFHTNSEGWQKIFQAVQYFNTKLYNSEVLCFRDFFIEALVAKEATLYASPAQDTILQEKSALHADHARETKEAIDAQAAKNAESPILSKAKTRLSRN